MVVTHISTIPNEVLFTCCRLLPLLTKGLSWVMAKVPSSLAFSDFLWLIISRVCAKSLQLCPTLQAHQAHQAPLSMGFSGQDTRVGYHALLFPDPGIELTSLMSPTSPASAGGFFTTSAAWEAQLLHGSSHNRDQSCLPGAPPPNTYIFEKLVVICG